MQFFFNLEPYLKKSILIIFTDKETVDSEIKSKQRKPTKKQKKIVKDGDVPEESKNVEEVQEPETQKEPDEEKTPDDIIQKEVPTEKKEIKKTKLTPIKIERMDVKLSEAQHPENVEGPQFTKLKLKKPSLKPKQEVAVVSLPKFQLKSRIRYVNDWPPQDIKPIVTYLGSVRQNGELSRNIKEASKIKKKPLKLPEIPDLEKVTLEEPEKMDFDSNIVQPVKTILEEPQKVDDINIPESPTQEKRKLSDVEKVPIKDIQFVKTKEPQESLVKPKIDEPFEAPKVKEDLTEPDQKSLEESQPQITEKQKSKPSKQKSKPSKQEKVTPDVKETTPIAIDKPDKPLDEKEPQKDTPQTDEPHVKDDIKEDEIQEAEKPKFTEAELPQKKPTEKKPKKIKKKEVIEKTKDASPVRLDDVLDQDSTEPVLEHKQETEVEPEKIETPSDITTEKKPKKPRKDQDKVKLEDKIEKPEDDLVTDLENEKPSEPLKDKKIKPKLTPMKIERKTLKISQAQHAENVESQQFTKLKLKKTVTKPKPETTAASLPKFQLKSRITYIRDWPPDIIKPLINFLGSVRQNGILSRNVKEAAKIKKKVYKQPQLPEIEKTELEKPMFGHEDVIQIRKQSDAKVEEEVDKPEEISDEEPEQVTFKPRRPSVKKTEEIVDEVTIKKKLKPIRKSSVTLPEITEPENVTFRPKTTKTKEDVEQEFNIHLDSYAEEEISMSSKVKLKPQRHPTFNEEANEASIKFYEEGEEGPDIVEIIESDEDNDDEMANVMMPLKKKIVKNDSVEEINSSVTVHKPKKGHDSDVAQDVHITLDRKPKYSTENQEEVTFDVKPQKEQYTQEELSLSSKIKLKAKKKVTVSEAADETSIRLTQEIEDDSQQEEIILSEGESEENVEMVIKRKPKKPAYEVSEVEELSVELKPSRKKGDTYEEEQLTVLAKRKPRKPSQIQGKFNNILYPNIMLNAF